MAHLISADRRRRAPVRDRDRAAEASPLPRLILQIYRDSVRARPARDQREDCMPDSVYRVTEVIGVSSESWEAAARTAVETAARTVRDLRIAEVLQQDLTIENGSVTGFRVRLGISFKYDTGD